MLGHLLPDAFQTVLDLLQNLLVSFIPVVIVELHAMVQGVADSLDLFQREAGWHNHSMQATLGGAGSFRLF